MFFSLVKIRAGRDIKYLLFIYVYTAQTVGEPFGLDCKNRDSLQKLLCVKNNNINNMHVEHMATIRCESKSIYTKCEQKWEYP